MYGRKERLKRLGVDLLLEIIGLALLFGILLFAQTRFSLSKQQENSTLKLDTAEQRYETNISDAKDLQSRYDAFSQAKVDTVAYYYQFNMDKTSDMKEMATQWDFSEMYIVDNDLNVLSSYNSSVTSLKDDSALTECVKAYKPMTVESLRYYASQITVGTYLLAARDTTSLQETIATMDSLSNTLDKIKVGTKGYILAINNSDQTIAYDKDSSMIGKTLKEAGYDEAILKDEYLDWASCGDQEYYCETRVSTVVTGYTLVAMRPKTMIQSSIMRLVWMGLLVFALVVTIIVFYIHYLRVEQDRIYEEDRSEMIFLHLGGKVYFNQTIGSRIGHMLILALIFLLASSFYLQSLSVLSTQFAKFSDKKTDILAQFDDAQEQLTALTDEYNAEYERRTINLAWLLAKDPSLMEEDKLENIATKAQLKYIYVFNEKGAVIATNGINKDYVLPDDSEKSSYVFWNVVKGYQDTLVQDAREDKNEAEGYIQYIAAKRQDAKGMVEIAISPERLQNRVKNLQTNHILSNIAVENGGYTMAIDSESKQVIYHPDSDLIGRSNAKLGLSKSALSDGYTGYQTIDSVKCAVRSMQYNDDYIYIVVPVTSITSGRLQFSLITTIFGFIILLLISAFSLIGNPNKVLLSDPTDDTKTEPAVEAAKPEPRGSFKIVTGSGEIKQVESLFTRWGKSSNWSEKTPEQKLRHIMTLMAGIAGVALMIYMYTHLRTYDPTSVLSYIIHQKWEKAPNIFSLTYIAMIIVITIVLSTVCIKVISLLVTNMGARAETIAKLVCNFIKYFSVICAIFYCMNFVGIKASTLLASAGLMSLVIGLGAQSLIKDILAGIFIVFEGEFRVGDIITLGATRGTVREIGIRSTKIENFSQDIMIINNSEISGVINMTRKYSYAFCDVGIEYEESLERVESVLQKELPLMKERVPEIEAGPFYRGVVSLADSSVVIRILAQCQEAKRVQLQRDMNREIKLIFDRHNINIPFPQVVVNRPTSHEQATYLDRSTATDFVAEQKELTKDIKPQ